MRKPVPSGRIRKMDAGKKKALDDDNSNFNDPQNYLTMPSPDPCHNGGIPACLWMEDAMMQHVFPELQLSMKQKQQQNKEASALDATNNLTSTISSSSSFSMRKKQQKQPKKEESKGKSSQIQQQRQGKAEDPETAVALPRPNALGELLRWRFLQLAAAEEEQSRHNDGRAEGNPESTGTKKKNKKRKKKKKENEKDSGGATTTTTDSASDLSMVKVPGDTRTEENGSNGDRNGTVTLQTDPAQSGINLVEELQLASGQALENGDKGPSDSVYTTLNEAQLPSLLERAVQQLECRSRASEQTEGCTHRRLFFQWINREISSDGVTEKDWKSFLEFCNRHITPNGKGSFVIQLKDVAEIAKQIECQNCRVDTLSTIARWAEQADKGDSNSSVLAMNPRYLKPPKTGVEKDLESAFEYQIMEEGGLLQKETDSDHEDSADYLTFILVGADGKRSTGQPKNGNSNRGATPSRDETSKYCIQVRNLNVASLDSLLQDWLLQGVRETFVGGEMSNTEGDDDYASQYRKRISVIKEEVSSSLAACCELRDSDSEEILTNEIHMVSAEIAKRDAFHFTASNILQNCDEMCQRYMSQELKGLLLFAAETIILSGDFLEEMGLWSVFFQALSKVSQECEDYYEKIEEDGVDQNGVIHCMMTSPKARELCCNFLFKKIDIMTKAGMEIKKIRTQNSMKKRLVEGLWVNTEVPYKREDSNVDLSMGCIEIVVSLITWTGEKRARRMKEIRRAQTMHRESLRDKIKEVQPILYHFFEEVEPYFTEEEKDVLHKMMDIIEKLQGRVSIVRSEENRKVFEAGESTIIVWRCCRIGEYRRLKSYARALPLPLKSWTTEMEGMLDIGLLAPISSLCWPGAGGKRRVRFILAGILHRWLSEMCIEWRSEAAALELLTDFDAESVPTPHGSGASTKVSKKSKKKKKAAPQISSVEVLKSTLDRKSMILPESREEDLKRDDLTTAVNSGLHEEILDVGDNENQGSEETNSENESEGITVDVEIAGILGNGDHVMSSELHTVASTSEVDFDLYESAVGVRSENGKLMSATDFLLARFAAVMDNLAVGDDSVVMVSADISSPFSSRKR